ncbi:Trp biosynthesis-associated membrane protein, partial [Crystallibacter crystallopoietes]|uniref:Trp biosynthesis-associated membrane protein n=1 Tax=Crystallibacter crystallopoietes TaxID=37928 RepID=UPI0005C1AF0A
MTTTGPAAGPASRWARKGTVVLAAIAASLAAFGTTTQTWLNVRLPQGDVQTPDIAVPGSEAAVAVTALALVGLAAALAASI